jgi:aryl-alcohol dehydrogenase-like predicted oxidoreductase
MPAASASAGGTLVLGGHSFITQLGNDPVASEEQQAAIVQACLDSGITWFDTTYQPERVALGLALEQLGRRGDATIIAWNFFTDFGPDDGVGGAAAYQPHHLQLMLDQLRTDTIDCLVVHGTGDGQEDTRQLELAMRWQQDGRVGRLGTWHPPANASEVFGAENPYSFMVRPYNVKTTDAAGAFAVCKELGWENVACSPFVRGWELDKLVEHVQRREGGSEDATRSRLADHMLRYSVFAPNVDKLIVAMRKVQWVGANSRSVQRGPLTRDEARSLESATGEQANA